MATKLVTSGLVGFAVSYAVPSLAEHSNSNLRTEIQRKRHTKKEQHIRKQTTKQNELDAMEKELNTKMGEFKQMEETIEMEEKKIERFENIHNDKNTKFMMVLGHTGDGKSTVLNRLYGDNSEYGDKGPFKANDDVDSVTTKLDHRAVKINNFESVLVDTPGYKDTNGEQRDDEHFNNLGEYLYGCCGVDAFILVMNGTNIRFDGNIKAMMSYYVEYFGDALWKHLVLVITRIEGYERNKFYDKNRAKLYQQKIHDAFDSIEDDCNIPIITIGYAQNYKQFRQDIMNAVKNISDINGKLQCKHIMSPIRKLQRAKKELNDEIEKLKVDIQSKKDEAEEFKKLAEEEQTKIDQPSWADTIPLILNHNAEI